MEAPRIIQISPKDRSSVSPLFQDPYTLPRAGLLAKLHFTRETAQSSAPRSARRLLLRSTPGPPSSIPHGLLTRANARESGASEAFRAQIQEGLLSGNFKIGPLLFSLDALFSHLCFVGQE